MSAPEAVRAAVRAVRPLTEGVAVEDGGPAVVAPPRATLQGGELGSAEPSGDLPVLVPPGRHHRKYTYHKINY